MPVLQTFRRKFCNRSLRAFRPSTNIIALAGLEPGTEVVSRSGFSFPRFHFCRLARIKWITGKFILQPLEQFVCPGKVLRTQGSHGKENSRKWLKQPPLFCRDPELTDSFFSVDMPALQPQKRARHCRLCPQQVIFNAQVKVSVITGRICSQSSLGPFSA